MDSLVHNYIMGENRAFAFTLIALHYMAAELLLHLTLTNKGTFKPFLFSI